MTLEGYVAKRVVDDAGCLRWTGYVYNGHPGGTLNGRKFLVRRAVYEAAHGAIPRGLIVRCICETPLCVADDCLKLTTYKAVAKVCGAQGLMSGPVRSARIAEVKRAGKQAKITQEDARAIRASDETGVVLAARYRLSQATISKIQLGQVRREFTGNPWQGL